MPLRRNCRRTDRQSMTSHTGVTQMDSLGRPRADSGSSQTHPVTVRALVTRPWHQPEPLALEQRGVQRAATGTRVYAVQSAFSTCMPSTVLYRLVPFSSSFTNIARCVCGRVSKQSHDRPSQMFFRVQYSYCVQYVCHVFHVEIIFGMMCRAVRSGPGGERGGANRRNQSFNLRSRAK